MSRLSGVQRRAMVARLIEMYGRDCHYCYADMSSDVPGHKLYPTIEHVIPKCHGGKNKIDNYVLVCWDCNNKRGSSLMYCDCRDCKEIVLDFLYDPVAVRKCFDMMVAFNKPRVKKNKHGKWIAYCHNATRSFRSFDDALEYALNGSFRRDM